MCVQALRATPNSLLIELTRKLIRLATYLLGMTSLNMGLSRPLFVYFRPSHITLQLQSEKM